MTLKMLVEDGKGRGVQARVEDEGLLTSLFPCPPMLPQKNRVFRQYMTDDGLITGDEDMTVVGSAAAPIQFWIHAEEDCDRYITALNFYIEDASAVLAKFGNIAALANGCRLFYNTREMDVDLHPMLQSNFDFIRLCACGSWPATGTDATVARLKNAVGLGEAYTPTLDLRWLVPHFGIKLDMGTQQRLVLEVRDDTTGVDAFNIIAYGFDRFE